jgi:hypothetical protein
MNQARSKVKVSVPNVTRTPQNQSFYIPVTSDYTKEQMSALKWHSDELMHSLIDSTGESVGYGLHAMELHNLQVQGTYQGGRRAGKELDVSRINRAVAYTAGSGNTPEDAEKAVSTRKEEGDMTISTTSGGWPQNLSRVMLPGMMPQIGTLNSAFKMGIAKAIAERGKKVEISSFSQGSISDRDAQDALGKEQLTALTKHPEVDFKTLGGASKLITPHTAFKGLLDPVPCVSTLVDMFRTTKSGTQVVQRVNHSHSGEKYAQSLKETDKRFKKL